MFHLSSLSETFNLWNLLYFTPNYKVFFIKKINK